MSGILFLAILCCQQIGGQWRIETPLAGGSGDGFGSSMASGPDVNGDGVRDVLVSEPYRGDVRCFSGRTGSQFWEWSSPYSWSAGEAVGAIPDLNGDGILDVIVGSPGDSEMVFFGIGRLFILDGRTGTSIREHPGSWNAFDPGGEWLGYAVLGTADVDGDGHGDYIAGAPLSDRRGLLAEHSGTVACWSGATGSLVWIQHGQYEELFGFALSHGPDLTGDGRPEILVGAPASSYSARPQGLVYVLDGSSGAVLSQILGSNYLTGTRPFGSSLALLADLNGDGIEDFFVGAPSSSPNGVPYAGEGFVLSGLDASLLWSLAGWKDDQRLAGRASRCSDLDEDGVEDVAISAVEEALTPGGYEGRVYLHSGKTGEPLAILQNPGSPWQGFFGLSLLLHEHPDRAEPILLIGESYGGTDPFGSTGLVWPFTFEPFLRADVHSVSAAAGGDVRFRVDFPETETGQPYAVLVSGTGTGPTVLGGAVVPLTQDAWFARSVQGSLPPLLQNARGVLDLQGDAWCGLRAPPGTLGAIVGRTLYFAAVTGSSGAVAYSSVAVRLLVLM